VETKEVVLGGRRMAAAECLLVVAVLSHLEGALEAHLLEADFHPLFLGGVLEYWAFGLADLKY